jgi:hypothetical protein
LIQASRQWNRKLEEEIISHGFKTNDFEPYVFLMEGEKGFLAHSIYVNSSIIAGEVRLKEDTIKRLEVFYIEVQKILQTS